MKNAATMEAVNIKMDRIFTVLMPSVQYITIRAYCGVLRFPTLISSIF